MASNQTARAPRYLTAEEVIEGIFADKDSEDEFFDSEDDSSSEENIYVRGCWNETLFIWSVVRFYKTLRIYTSSVVLQKTRWLLIAKMEDVYIRPQHSKGVVSSA